VTTTNAPSALFFLEEIEDFPSRGYRFLETLMERREQNEMRTFWPELKVLIVASCFVL